MFFKSKYIIEFSKSKNELLTNIDDKLSKSIFDIGKEYIGTTSENSFQIQLSTWKNSPTITGKFIKKNEKNYLDVRIGYLYNDVLIYIIFIFLLPIYMISLSDYKTAFLFFGIGITSLFINIITLKFLIRKFFSELKSYDRLCRISKINYFN
ncbi:hypothetical protein [Chryseobacterium sp. PET-29]|uniref:hypothetical protein n=1 Tax=Chryseobacterium sp. PET-29 TaxID=2983267 RepID=UPI0021E620D8|nr:hypothetical protein [Chryseobacterium sp. PET-29]